MLTPRLSTPLLLALALSTPAAARQEADPEYDEQDLQAVATEEAAMYGRVRYVDGSVSLRRDSAILDTIEINEPLVPGDTLRTGAGSRLEAQTAEGNLLRLDGESELAVLNLPGDPDAPDDTTLLQLLSGSLIVFTDSLTGSEARFRIDTDSASIFILSDGLFRIDIRSDGATVVSSRRGAAEVSTNDDSSMLRSGERVVVLPDQGLSGVQVFNTRARDEFDDWADERDEALVRHQDAGAALPADLPDTVEPYASELSYYGHWFNYPSYGWVWRPSGLASDWQPYYYGRWSWSPYGAFWVSHEPWGWAPYHYGRWEFLIGYGWVWIPGNLFSGGWVAWSYSPGYFGWCPLGFYDYPVRFHARVGGRHPWIYVRSRHLYERHVNRVIVRDVTIVRDIEARHVVVRRGPRVSPDRVRANPSVATELHTRLRGRPDQVLTERSVERRTPFRELERRQMVRANGRRIEREGRAGVTAGSGAAVERPVPFRGGSAEPRRTRRFEPARSAEAPAREPSVERPSPSERRFPAARRPFPREAEDRKDEGAPAAERPRPSERWQPERQERRPAASSGEPPQERSRPERVVPRIVPRREPPPDPSTTPQAPRSRAESGERRGGERGRPPQRGAGQKQNRGQQRQERRGGNDKDKKD